MALIIKKAKWSNSIMGEFYVYFAYNDDITPNANLPTPYPKINNAQGLIKLSEVVKLSPQYSNVIYDQTYLASTKDVDVLKSLGAKNVLNIDDLSKSRNSVYNEEGVKLGEVSFSFPQGPEGVYGIEEILLNIFLPNGTIEGFYLSYVSRKSPIYAAASTFNFLKNHTDVGSITDCMFYTPTSWRNVLEGTAAHSSYRLGASRQSLLGVRATAFETIFFGSLIDEPKPSKAKINVYKNIILMNGAKIRKG